MKLLQNFTIIALTCLLGLSGCSASSKSGKSGTGLSESELNAQRDSRFGEGNIPRAEGEGLFRDIFFDFDSTKITPEARADIEYNVQVLHDHNGMHIMLEGHCDERGTAQYNMALGSKRAQSVRQVLTSLGIPASQLDTVSYGSEVPLDQGHNEAAWAKNRRVHASPYTK